MEPTDMLLVGKEREEMLYEEMCKHTDDIAGFDVMYADECTTDICFRKAQ